MFGRWSILTLVALTVPAGAFPGDLNAQGGEKKAKVTLPTAESSLPTPAAQSVPPVEPISSPEKCQLQDRNGTLLWGLPLLDPPPTPPGWFTALEVDVVGPAIKQHVVGQVLIGGAATDVQLPTATLDWTGAPRLELGYRLPAALGELAIAYRLLATEGSGVIPGFDAAGAGALKSRLDAHVVYLDYMSREFSLWPRADMKVHAGVCLPSIFFDSRATGALLDEQTSNYYFGAGPHLGFDFWHHLPIQGLELYTRLEGALTVGHVRQHFEEVMASPGSEPVGDSSSVKKVREVPTLHLEVGLGYTAPWPDRQLRFLVGYTAERWWYVAQIPASDSRGELTVQGVFLRAEWGF